VPASTLDEGVGRTERTLDDVLALAIDAHGGMNRWEQLSRFRATASITGPLCVLTGRPGLLTDVVLEGETRDQRLRITPFPSAGRHATWAPDRQTIETSEGAVLVERRDPASAFRGRARDFPWDDLQVAYFASEANWNYFAAPFVLARPDFVVQEIEPWSDGREVWRRLFVTYPENLAVTSRQLTYYFDSDGYLRRLDYAVDVLGGAAAVQYPSDYREFDGITVATRRTVYERNPADSTALGSPWVMIDLTRVTFR
jgi:hypothetical protein